jgi:hypothetical protein
MLIAPSKSAALRSLSLIALLCLSRNVNAFDSAEHCSLSNLAALIAFDYVTRDNGGEVAEEGSPRALFNRELAQARSELLPFDKVTYNVASTNKSATDWNQFYDYCGAHNWPNHIARVPLSYGKVVALVDFTLDPRDLFNFEGTSSQIPTITQQLNQRFFLTNRPAHDSKDRLTSIAAQLRLSLTYFNSSHNNDRHFQEGAIDSFYQLHATAMSAAREDARALARRKTSGASSALTRSLAYSAIADHFLEDNFAPGHVMTPRNGMYDATALSWHDAYNARGRAVAVRNWADLAGLFAFARDRSVMPQYEGTFQRIGNRRRDSPKRKQVPPLTFTQALGALLEKQVSGHANATEGDLMPCSHGNSSVLSQAADPYGQTSAKFLDLNPTLLNSIDEHLREAETSQEHGGATPAPSAYYVLCLRGDGSLDGHVPSEARDAAIQKALMVLVEARYIVDVLSEFGAGISASDDKGRPGDDLPLQAFGLDAPIDPDSEYRHIWCGPHNSAESGPPSTGTDKVVADIDATCRDMLSHAESECRYNNGKACAATYLIPAVGTHYIAYASTPTPDDAAAAGVSDYRDWLIALRAGSIAANHQTLAIAGFEFGPPLNQSPDALFPNWLSLGYARQVGDSTNLSNIFTARDAFQLPSIDFQLGPYANLEDIGNGSARRWRWSSGVRADAGFSLLSIYFGVGWEPKLEQPVHTVRGVAFGGGFSLVFNGRRAISDVRSWFDGL